MRFIVGSGYGMGGFVQDVVTDFERRAKNVAVPATTTIKKKVNQTQTTQNKTITKV